MRIPSIDERTKKDLTKYIKTAAAAYTPEWRFDAENPDVGTALAMIYADMFEGSIKRFNKIPEKYRVAFYNEINASRLPAIPAFGYVAFTLSGPLPEGQEVPAGTQLIADTNDEEENFTVFETMNDVCAVQAEPTDIFCCSGRYDYISQVYEKTEEKEQTPTQEQGFALFDLKGENLQEHLMYFCHENVLNINNGAWIEVAMNPHFRHSISQDMLEALIDESRIIWEYHSAEGWMRFSGQRIQDGKLLFYKNERQPRFSPTEMFGLESFWIRCKLLDIDTFEELHLDRLTLASTGAGIEPDSVNSGGVDQNIYEFLPFGANLTVYNEMYLASEDALCKKGAKITINFNLDFVQVPLDLDIADPALNWKLIMKRSRFRIDETYDISIGEVIWEYYNGNGWAKLFDHNEYRYIFNAGSESSLAKYMTMEFQCPDDIEKVLVNATESYYIRARILKVNNAYKVKGNYISPVIEGLALSYTFENNAQLPNLVVGLNNLETLVYPSGALSDENFFFTPFYKIAEDKTALYTGFELMPSGGPIKMLYTFKEALSERSGRVTWEYYSTSGWTLLNVADETENFNKTGIVTFMGPSDFSKKVFWNKDMYWIRMIDAEDRYGDIKTPVQLPYINKIYMNATQIKNIVSGNKEYFYIEPHEENFECRLINKKIQEITVEVFEEGNWVKWTEVSDFARSESESRHYVVDRNDGIVCFSDGNNGKIPPTGDTDTIRVTYSTGGGSIGNLQAGFINRSNRAIGFIGEIFNPSVTFGGCDEEDTAAAVLRNASAIKHGYRGVTARDFEALALEATRNILKAKCFSGYCDTGEKMPGAITLVILQKDFENGRDYFDAIKEQVMKYIGSRVSGDLIDMNKFFVTSPQFLEMCMKVELTVSSYNQVFKVKQAVHQKLDEFLNPMTGNFDRLGWAIGKLPNNTQVMNSLKNVQDVRYIKNVLVSAFTEGRFGRVEADPDSMKDQIFALPLSGRHEVVISVDEGR